MLINICERVKYHFRKAEVSALTRKQFDTNVFEGVVLVGGIAFDMCVI